jgi:hypothetical protein
MPDLNRFGHRPFISSSGCKENKILKLAKSFANYLTRKCYGSTLAQPDKTLLLIIKTAE